MVHLKDAEPNKLSIQYGKLIYGCISHPALDSLLKYKKTSPTRFVSKKGTVLEFSERYRTLTDRDLFISYLSSYCHNLTKMHADSYLKDRFIFGPKSLHTWRRTTKNFKKLLKYEEHALSAVPWISEALNCSRNTSEVVHWQWRWPNCLGQDSTN